VYRVGYYQLGSVGFGTSTSVGSSVRYNAKAAGTGVNFTGSDYASLLRYTSLSAAGSAVLQSSALTVTDSHATVDLYFVHASIEALIYGTHLTARVTDGTNYSAYGTITKLCAYDSTSDWLHARLTYPSESTSVAFDIAMNTKAQMISGMLMTWR